jgi:formylglycine-generating enzyme required for sulfatase activity/Tol biopolymer transport system component
MKKFTIITALFSVLLTYSALHAKVDMVYIPGGEFEMGDHHDGMSISLPVHSVYVDSFYMSRYEITNQQYCDFLNNVNSEGLIEVSGGVVYPNGGGNAYCDTTDSSSYSRITWNGSDFGVVSGKEDHPMVRVSWYGAVAYCDYYGYRLPTEAEWEYAGRGGEHSPYYRYPWGNTMNGSKANYLSSGDPHEGTPPESTPVGYYDGGQIPTGTDMANGYGLYDMTGNVFEWCNDWYSETYYQECDDIGRVDNPEGPASGTYRVLRGGSWGDSVDGCRVAYHGHNYPNRLDYYYGFRVASLPEPAEGWIAFVSNQDGDADIWAIQPDGSGLHQVVNMPGTQDTPQWSPDSSKIAFASNYQNTYEIWVYDWFQGTKTRIYTGSDCVHNPAWSPDGQSILFSEGYSSPDIFVMNSDGTNVQRVPVEEGYTMWPSWSPHGDSFVYHRRSGGHSLWVYDFSVTGNILDTNNYDQPLAPADTHQADWTPNGNVVLMWDYNIAILNPGSPGDWSDPLAPDVNFLTTDASYPSLCYTSPCWSPDPNCPQIAFTRESTTQDLWIMNSDGSDAYALLATASQEERPDWGNPIETIEATINLDPDVFEVEVEEDQEPEEPEEAFLTAFIELPAAVDPMDIDVETVTLSVDDTILATAESPAIEDNVLEVLFRLNLVNVSTILGLEVTEVEVDDEKIEVNATTAPAQAIDLIELTVSGDLTNGGSFTGTDAVRVVLENDEDDGDEGEDEDRADVNADGMVNFRDFSILANRWLEGATP